MTCSNCVELREQLREAQRELGLRRRDGAIGALMHRLGVRPIHALLLIDMYEAKGRCISKDTLIENAAVKNECSLKTHVCLLRSIIGDDAIVTYPTRGYGLSPIGMSRVLAAPEPTALQDARE